MSLAFLVPPRSFNNLKAKSQKVFGTGKKSAREAAIFLAEFLDEPYVLPSAPPRAPHGSRLTESQREEKKHARLAELQTEASSLGIPEEMPAEEEAEAV